MGHAQRILPSAAEYLAAEELSPIRHEYVNGEIFALYLSFETGDTVEFSGMGLDLPVQELYQDTGLGGEE